MKTVLLLPLIVWPFALRMMTDILYLGGCYLDCILNKQNTINQPVKNWIFVIPEL